MVGGDVLRGRTTTLLKLIVYLIGFIVLMLCVFWLPNMAQKAALIDPSYAYLKYPVLIGIYLTVLPFFFALFHSLKLLSYINHKNAFSELAVTSLKGVKYCAILICLLYLVGMVFLITQEALHPGIALIGFAILFASFSISLFAAVLQELFTRALEIKSENDLTV